MTPTPLLFLDFDGVLSPGISGTLIYRDKLEKFLFQHTSIQVVLSTSWRIDYPFADLVAVFAEAIQPRIIGKTPDLEHTGQRAIREIEIKTWLKENNPRAKWVALDDDASLFSGNCPQLVLCETIRGLREKQCREIEQKLDLT